MSFWSLSDGGNAKDTGNDFDIGGGNFEPIPAGSSLMAMMDQAKWETKDGARFIELKWVVVAPDAYKNRTVFHKLWVGDFDPDVLSKKGEQKAKDKRDKARRMLAAIDANAGGKLMQIDGVPSDDQLAMHLCNKPMVITLMVWDMVNNQTGEPMSGNWVCAVSGKDKELSVGDAPKQKPTSNGGGGGAPAGGNDFDEIPF